MTFSAVRSLPCFQISKVKLSLFCFSLCAGLMLLASGTSAQAQCSSSPCSGGAINDPANSPSGKTSTINVSAGGTITNVYVELDGVTSIGDSKDNGDYQSMSAAAFMLTAPNGDQIEFLGATGDGDDGGGLSGYTITVQDAAASMAPSEVTNNLGWEGSSTWTVKPSSYFKAWGETDPIGGSSQWASSDASATFANQLNGVPVNGTWTLTIADNDTFCGCVTSDPITISGWKLYFTANVTSAQTTTSLSSNSSNHTSFTSGSSSSVTLTASVTSSSTVNEGTVTFKDGSNTISCSGGNQAVSNGQATCTTTFTTEGNHDLEAVYNGTTNFSTSPSAGLEQFVKNHSTLTNGQYCNSGAITVNGGNISPYPSVVNVGTDTTALTGSVANVSVTLNGLSASGGLFEGYGFLLVAPDTSKAYNLDFLSSAGGGGSQPSVNVTFADNNPSAPDGSPLSSGTYEATDLSSSADIFAASTSPAPSTPGTFNYAQPDDFGNNPFTFQQAFSGANGNGDWTLFAYNNEGGESLAVTGGWCINITQNNGVATSTALASPTNPAPTGSSVTITATVTSSGSPVASGSVTFTENGVAPAGVSSNIVNLNGSGQASITTSSLSEGDHHITASYSGVSATYDPSSTTLWQRIDTPSTVSGAGSSSSPAVVCNPSGFVIPAGAQPQNIGQAAPNPSNIFVSNMPGALQSVEVELNNFHTGSDPSMAETASLLVGPNGTGFDFYSGTGDNTTILSTGNYDFFDTAANTVPDSPYGPGSYLPTAYDSTDTFFASPSGFYTLPGSFDYAQPHNNPFTFNGESNGAFTGINPNGTWSLYFNQNTHENGAGASSWCVSIIDSLPSLSVTASHNGSISQGQQGAQFTVAVINEGSGPTGDPSGSNPLTVTDTLNAAFTPGTLPTGTPWNCTASGQTVTCTNDSAVAQSSSYATLTIPVNVTGTASGSVSNTVSVSGGGANPTTSNTDTFTIEVPPAITSANSTTFTVGAGSSFNVTTNATPTAALNDGGATLPSGVTFTDNGNGTATLAGTPALSTGGSYPFTITATNGTSPNATQSFILTVDQAPAITSPNSTSFNGGTPGSFTITTSGYPVPTVITLASGVPPNGVTFTNNGNGTATLAGNATAAGNFPLSIEASNGVQPNAGQNFTLTINSVSAAITTPAPNSTLTGPSQTFTWNAATGASEYELWLGTTGVGSKNLYNSGGTTNTSITLGFMPTNGVTINARLLVLINGVWHSSDYTYTAVSSAVLTTPMPGATLTWPAQMFSWQPVSGATKYELWIGTSLGASNLYNSGGVTGTSYSVSNLPTNGEKIYVRLLTEFNGVWGSTDSTFTAVEPAQLSSPTPMSALTSANVTFSWSAVANATAYELWLSKVGVGQKDLYNSGGVTGTSVTVDVLPTAGQTIYARLLTSFNGVWQSSDTTYTAVSSAMLTSPLPNSMLPGPTTTFSWSAPSGATQFELWLSKVGAGQKDLYNSGAVTGTSLTVNNLPTNTSGTIIYATLLTSFNGVWSSLPFQYTAATPAVLTAPTPNSTLTGSTATFTWTAPAGATSYELLLSTVGFGQSDLYNSTNQHVNSITVSKLPTNGQPIYATLLTNFNGTWESADFSYTAQ